MLLRECYRNIFKYYFLLKNSVLEKFIRSFFLNFGLNFFSGQVKIIDSYLLILWIKFYDMLELLCWFNSLNIRKVFSRLWSGIRDISNKQFGLLFIEPRCIIQTSCFDCNLTLLLQGRMFSLFISLFICLFVLIWLNSCLLMWLHSSKYNLKYMLSFYDYN